MKRIIVCCDGTWNAPDQMDRDRMAPTNVVRLARAVLDAGHPDQVLWYDPGIGSDGGWLHRTIAGLTGRGISANIREAYAFLVDAFEPGDGIYLFGFSRGAYTVRSLAGMVRKCGVLPRGTTDARIAEAYAFYRSDVKPTSPEAERFRAAHAGRLTEIHCIGVFDTVGALGIPGFRGLLARSHRFHDVQLSSYVRNAFQALAIDERRRPFEPSIWEPAPGDRSALTGTPRVLEQVWFAGVHSNVGGGYVDTGLSDVALDWMLRKAMACGLEVAPGAAVAPDRRGELRDSFRWWYGLIGERRRPVADKPGRGEAIHASAKARLEDRTVAHYRRGDAPNLADALDRGIPVVS